jgi:hypothetical protein
MALSKDVNSGWVDRILENIEGLQYGHIQIIIHDGKIVQIDRLERQRFDQPESAASTTKAIRK